MKKAIFMRGSDAKLSELMRNVETNIDLGKERLKWLDLQRDKLFEESRDRSAKTWDLIEAELKRLDLLPSDYSKEKYSLQKEENVIFLLDKETAVEHALDTLVRSLTSGLSPQNLDH